MKRKENVIHRMKKPNSDFTFIIIIKMIRIRDFVSKIIIIRIMNRKYVSESDTHCIDLYVEIKFNEMIYGFK